MSWSPTDSAVRDIKAVPELLAPAGSWDSMRAALQAGADAVYMGGPRYGARAYADNPDESGLARAVDYCHLRGRRLYLTVNTLLKEAEMGDDLYRYIRPLYEQGLDGVIVQDLGVFSFLRRAFPALPLHGSTQMAVAGPEGAALLQAQGLKRLVLPRELSLEEIREIYDKTGLELEVFIHGALCYCYSGQCLMSSLLGGRSGNRGRCAQPCRLPYEGGSWLNMRDLSGLDILPELLESGVCSLKIEGRMKSPVYTAGVVEVYRRRLDELMGGGPRKAREADRRRLFDLFNRGAFTDAYFSRQNGGDMVNPGGKQSRIGLDEAAEAALKTRYLGRHSRRITGHIRLQAGEAVSLDLSAGDTRVSLQGATAEAAAKRPLEAESIRRQLLKTGDSEFGFESLKIEMEAPVFLPLSELNQLRRRGLEALQEQLLDPFKRAEAAPYSESAAKTAAPSTAHRPALCVLVNDRIQLEEALKVPAVQLIYLPGDYFPPEELPALGEEIRRAGKALGWALPFVMRGKVRRDLEKAEKLAALRQAAPERVLIRSLDGLGFWLAKDLPGIRVLDAGVYSWNRASEDFAARLGAQVLTWPLELHEKDLFASGMPREQLVYGRLPLMISAQCVQKNREGCLKEAGKAALEAPHFTLLKDRTGALLPHESRCRYCLSVIYNALPLFIGDMARPDCDWRLQLTTEDCMESRRILRLFGEAMARGEAPRRPEDWPITRGNYKRGVQ